MEAPPVFIHNFCSIIKGTVVTTIVGKKYYFVFYLLSCPAAGVQQRDGKVGKCPASQSFAGADRDVGTKGRRSEPMVVIKKARTEDEMKQVYDIRREVFIEEQGISEEIEMDGRDDEAVHVLAVVDDQPAGCGRLLYNGNEARIGRVAVRKHMRRRSPAKAYAAF